MWRATASRGASRRVAAPTTQSVLRGGLGKHTTADQCFHAKRAAAAVQAHPASIRTLGACRGQPFVFDDLFLFKAIALQHWRRAHRAQQADCRAITIAAAAAGGCHVTGISLPSLLLPPPAAAALLSLSLPYHYHGWMPPLAAHAHAQHGPQKNAEKRRCQNGVLEGRLCDRSPQGAALRVIAAPLAPLVRLRRTSRAYTCECAARRVAQGRHVITELSSAFLLLLSFLFFFFLFLQPL